VSYHVKYKEDFAEMRKKYPMLSDDEIDEKIEEKYFEEEEGEQEEEKTHLGTQVPPIDKKEEESAALLT
jgi:hypothetical protein